MQLVKRISITYLNGCIDEEENISIANYALERTCKKHSKLYELYKSKHPAKKANCSMIFAIAK